MTDGNDGQKSSDVQTSSLRSRQLRSTFCSTVLILSQGCFHVAENKDKGHVSVT